MARIIQTGCTVTNTFTLPCGEGDIAVLYITYQQGGETVLEKTKEDCAFDQDEEGHSRAVVALSQEDTLKFDWEAGAIRVQIRLRTREGTAMKSRPMTATADELLREGVI